MKIINRCYLTSIYRRFMVVLIGLSLPIFYIEASNNELITDSLVGVNSVPVKGVDSGKTDQNIASDSVRFLDSTKALSVKCEEGNEMAKGNMMDILTEKFVQGGPAFMSVIALCLILGLCICIERVIYLNAADMNYKKFMSKIEDKLLNEGQEAALALARDTKGPVPSIVYQGISRMDKGLDVVEKSIISYGNVQTGLLERNLSWITLFITLAPSLGFLGTVIGMVQAFQDIKIAGDISPTVVASGMEVALITTIAGLIVAIVLQIFYNYILTQIERITNSMEDAAVDLMDILVKLDAKI